MDPEQWGESSSGNPICTVWIEDHEYTVIIFPRGRKYGFLITDEGDNKTWSKNDHPTLKEARKWAWTRLELMS